MRGFFTRLCLAILLLVGLAHTAFPQQALTWQQVRDKFEAANPSLRAGQIGVAESRTSETTAYLRPNPNVTVLADQIDPFTTNPSRPFSNALYFGALNYLHERQGKRELRRESAQGATVIATSSQADFERNLLFTLRTAFVHVLQGMAVVELLIGA